MYKFLKLLFITSILFVLKLNAQDYKTISQDQYQKYFPESFDKGIFFPNTSIAFILPTNESDKTLQKEVNEFYTREYININKRSRIPPDSLLILTDKEALSRDLSNINIYSLGTIEGNLWTAQFIRNSKDFPVRIYKDSIIADTVYQGYDHIVEMAWYNPENPEHALFLYIPQNNEYAKNNKRYTHNQLNIWKEKERIEDKPFCHLINNKWTFSELHDTSLFQHQEAQKYWYRLERIEGSRIFRHPKYEELKNCLINESYMPFDTINMNKKDCNFTDFADFEWIKDIFKNNKIIAIGEQHHLKENAYLLKRILFAANTFDDFPILICEIPFSYSGYLDYYIQTKDDEIARTFRDSVLVNITESFIPTLNCIRDWNKIYPEKNIKIACSDIEHDFRKTIQLFLNPYFKKIDPKFNFQFKERNLNYDDYIQKGQKLIDIAKELNISGKYPFENPAYMESVFENLKSSFPIKLDPKKHNDHTDRYKVMIRNVTNDAFLGNLITNNKSVFYGGADHFRTLYKGDEEAYIGTEGFYLANVFEATKDSVYSIQIKPLTYCIEDSIQKIDPRLNYRLEKTLINLYKKGLIDLNEPTFAGNPYEVQRFFYKLSYHYSNYAFRYEYLKSETIWNRYSGLQRLYMYKSYKRKTAIENFNTTIMLPKANIGY